MTLCSFHPLQYQDAALYFMYPRFMVLLFAVAGVSSKLALDRQSFKEFLAAITRKPLVPPTIGLFVFQWISGYVNMMVTGAFADIPGFVLCIIMAVSGTCVLWSVQTLWLFTLVLPAVRKFEKGKLCQYTEKPDIPGLLFLAVPLWLSAQVLNVPVITVYRFGIYGLAFFLGYFILAPMKASRSGSAAAGCR